MPSPPPMLRYVSVNPSSLIFLMKSHMMTAASLGGGGKEDVISLPLTTAGLRNSILIHSSTPCRCTTASHAPEDVDLGDGGPQVGVDAHQLHHRLGLDGVQEPLGGEDSVGVGWGLVGVGLGLVDPPKQAGE
jgi:hypothetical protein